MIPRRRPLTDCDRDLIGVHDFAKSLPKRLAEKIHVWHQQELALSQVRKERGEIPITSNSGPFAIAIEFAPNSPAKAAATSVWPIPSAQLREYGRAQYRSIREVARMP